MNRPDSGVVRDFLALLDYTEALIAALRGACDHLDDVVEGEWGPLDKNELPSADYRALLPPEPQR